MSSVSGPLALSSLIASLERTELQRLIERRKPASPESIADALDLATELLKPDSIAQALATLPRETLSSLADFTPGTLTPLAELGLVGRGPAPDHSPVPLPEVEAQLSARLKSRGLSTDDLRAPADPPTAAEAAASATAPDTSGWFTAALAATGQVAWLLRDLVHLSVRLNRNGTVPSAWAKSVYERLGINQASELAWLMESAAIIKNAEGTLAIGETDWLARSHQERWIALARTAIALMPAPLLTLLNSTPRGATRSVTATNDIFPDAYPLAAQSTVERVARTAQLWERIGLTVQGYLSEVGSALIADPTGVGPRDLAFPDPVPGVYVQPDLSVIVPGLLNLDDESALAELTLPEQIGVASTLRFTEGSLGDALDRGFTAEQVRGLLERLSLTGIPQPLDYLLTALATRAGSVRVSIHHSDAGRTRIDFARPEIRTTMLVDRSLAHLQLHEAADFPAALFSRLRADHVLAALVDARYPAVSDVAVRSEGPLKPATLNTAAQSTAAQSRDSTAERDVYEELTERVFEAMLTGPSDIGRLVTLAIRDKTPIRVTVEIRGHVRDFTVLPVSLSAGRMRALDEAAGVERTLPVNAITSITQIP